MGARASRLRLTAGLAAGAWGVHELRYRAAFGARTSDVLDATGHGYLELMCPLIGLAVLCAAAQVLHAVFQHRRAATGRRYSLLGLWSAITVTLLLIFGAQEIIEGLLSPGHAAGLAGIVGQGGWLAVPLAAVFALLVATALREAQQALEQDLPLRVRLSVMFPAGASSAGQTLALPRCAGVAWHIAGRGPPAAGY